MTYLILCHHHVSISFSQLQYLPTKVKTTSSSRFSFLLPQNTSLVSKGLGSHKRTPIKSPGLNPSLSQSKSQLFVLYSHLPPLPPERVNIEANPSRLSSWNAPLFVYYPSSSSKPFSREERQSSKSAEALSLPVKPNHLPVSHRSGRPFEMRVTLTLVPQLHIFSQHLISCPRFRGFSWSHQV